MTIGELLPVPVATLLTGAVLAPLVARIHHRLPLVVGLIAALGAGGLLVRVAVKVYAGSGSVVTHFLSNERPQHGHALGIAFAADPFGLAFAMLAAFVGALLLLSALSELGDLGPKELGALACLIQILLAAIVGAALTADSVNLFVWFEVAALSSYGLTGFFLERPIALEATFKNLVLTSIAGFAVFLGSTMLYAATGALNLGELHTALPMDPDRAQRLAIALLIAGFATKAGLIPFHSWLPDAHTPVPGAVSALFSGLMVGLGVLGLARVALEVAPSMQALLTLLSVIGIISAIVGALMALVQDDLKRLLAWDTVSQTGIIVVGLTSRVGAGVAGAVYHLIGHGLFKALLFLCAGAVVHATGVTSVRDMGGLARSRPLLTGAFTVGCAAIAGLPPLTGYGSLSLIHHGLRDRPVLYSCALIAQVLTVAALTRAAYLGFFRRRPEPYEHLEPTRPGMRISLLTLAGACVAFGVIADLFVGHVATPAAQVLLDPGRYAHAVLSSGGTLAAAQVSIEYTSLSALLPALGEIAVGVVLAVFAVRTGLGRLVEPLRRLHTGSVNDYAAMSLAGLSVVAIVAYA